MENCKEIGKLLNGKTDPCYDCVKTDSPDCLICKNYDHHLVKNKVKCWDCGIEIEFDDDGITTDCMPDGYILPGIPYGHWICDDCGHERNLDR